MSSYSLSLVNTAVALGLLLLYTRAYRTWGWSPPFRAPKVVVVLFLVSNLFLVLVPFFPPNPGARTYHRLPYWVSACLGPALGWLGANLFILFRRPTQRAGYWYRVLACPIGTYGPSGDPRRRDTRSSENGSCSRTECPATPFGKYMGLRRN